MKPLLAALLFCSCNCAAVKPKPPAINFVDETKDTAAVWVCLYKPEDTDKEQLMCMSAKNFAQTFGENFRKDEGVNEL